MQFTAGSRIVETAKSCLLGSGAVAKLLGEFRNSVSQGY